MKIRHLMVFSVPVALVCWVCREFGVIGFLVLIGMGIHFSLGCLVNVWNRREHLKYEGFHRKDEKETFAIVLAWPLFVGAISIFCLLGITNRFVCRVLSCEEDWFL